MIDRRQEAARFFMHAEIAPQSRLANASPQFEKT
jgi:hypothetical protein